MYEAGDVRVEDLPDARLIEPTDALVRVARAAICGSDVWPYKSLPRPAAPRPHRLDRGRAGRLPRDQRP
jgi:threonine dehydrogenase-like Zn-dependent dehydrogenase